ncbi:hemolysin family protein [Bdellovibrionota bacterium FG-1]
MEFVICAVLVFTASYLSSAEIALFSLSRFQLRSLKERFRPAHRKIKRLLADPGGLLVTILVVNEIVNIALSSIITKTVSAMPLPAFLLSLHIRPWVLTTVLGMLLTAPIILFLCEITPKIIAASANRLIAPLTVGPLSLVYDALKPIRWLLKWIIAAVGRWNNQPSLILPTQNGAHPEEETLLRESDFLLMLEEGLKEGAIQQGELDLIKNVFELDDLSVQDIFTPLSQTLSLPEKTTLKVALATMRSQKFSRIPITGTHRKNVVGILYSKDLLRAKLETDLMTHTIDTLMRKPMFVPPTLRLNALFRRFKQHKTHMGVVHGDTGEAIGIVTMSDVLEALFEDFLPDEDEELGEEEL